MPAPGRGGAGNIEYARQTPPQRQAQASGRSQDIEAQRDYVAEKYIERKEEAQYAHMGRGGAGNFYKPIELSANGTFAASEVTDSKESSGPFQGRGGAGNLRDPNQSADSEKNGKDGGEPESLEKAEKLPRPESAHLRPPKPTISSKEVVDLPV